MSDKAFQSATFLSHDDQQIYYRFAPSENASDTMVIVHGHGEHTGRYLKFYDRLQKHKINLALFDLRGQGRSSGTRVHVDDFNVLVKDLSSFVNHLENEHDVSRPIILFGHSLGGLIATHWASKFQDRVKGLILSSPCLGLGLPSFLIKFNSFVRSLKSTFEYRNPVYPPHLSHNPQEIELYKKDPLIQRKITAGLLDEMIKYGEQISVQKSFKFLFPLFVLMAETEKVVDADRTLSFFEAVQAPTKEIYPFEGLYHEIFNEIRQDEVFGVLSECLEKLLNLPSNSS